MRSRARTPNLYLPLLLLQLFKALAVFALRDLDLLKIESRPLRSNPLVLVEGTGSSRSRMEFNYLVGKQGAA